MSIAPHLETIPARALTFSESSWHDGQQTLIERSPTILASNPAEYVTVEAYAEHLLAPMQLDLLDAQTGEVIDELHFTAGTSPDTVRSIPLVPSRIVGRISGTSAGDGRIVIARVLAPPAPADVPHALVPMLTPVWRLEGSLDPSASGIETAAKSVALIQIAEVGLTVACTGFLIDYGVIATARHCVRKVLETAASSGVEAGAACDRIGIAFDLRRTAGNTGPSVHCQSIEYVGKDARLVAVPTVPVAQVGTSDFALITVDQTAIRLANGAPREPLKLSANIQDGFGSVISYPQGELERVASWCLVGPGPENLMHHRCSTAPGSSGAPIIRYGKDGLEVIGLHVCCSYGFPINGDTQAELKDAEGVINFGVSATVIKDAIFH